MFSQRWSTFTLLSLITAVACIAYLAGRQTVLSHSVTQTKAAVELEPPASVVSQPTENLVSQKPTGKEKRGVSWQELAAMPRTPVSEDAMAAMIEKMAETDPQGAISLAASQANLRLKAALLRAALKGWGTADASAAAEWAKTETVMDQAQAIDALLQGAIQDPSKATGVVAALIKNNAGRASEFGSDLISALSESGHFDLAASFAVNGPENCRNDWILPAYSRWAEFQPEVAIANAMQITDPELRDTAMNAIITGWSPTDPKGLMEYAKNNLTAEQQGSAVTSALFFWAGSDPMAAATWINQNNPGDQANSGIAQIALSPQLSQTPGLAADWAENISDPQLRMDTLSSIFKRWMMADPAEAEGYIENSSVLTSEDRSQLLGQAKN